LVIWTFERKRQQQQTSVIAVARIRGRIRQSPPSTPMFPTFDGSAQINPLPRRRKIFAPGRIRADGLFDGITVSVNGGQTKNLGARSSVASPRVFLALSLSPPAHFRRGNLRNGGTKRTCQLQLRARERES